LGIYTATVDVFVSACVFVNAIAVVNAIANALAFNKESNMQLSINLSFPKGYVAHPYWPELEKVINIQKESGTRRARSEANRVKALSDHLHKIGMTNEQYVELMKKAERPFYTAFDVEKSTFGQIPVGKHDPDEIVIPPHQFYGCLAQASDLARASIRITTRDQLRSVLTIDVPVYTGKTEGDGVWERFAVVTAGTGAKLSNQRALRRNAYIGPFEGMFVVSFDDHVVNPDKVRDFITYAGREIGVGASRKMGWGRWRTAA
jgi:hypothetical protein